MGQFVIDRIKLAAWLLAFMAPVLMLEIGRELRAHWDQAPNYSEPTPEFAKAIAACEPIASADR